MHPLHLLKATIYICALLTTIWALFLWPLSGPSALLLLLTLLPLPMYAYTSLPLYILVHLILSEIFVLLCAFTEDTKLRMANQPIGVVALVNILFSAAYLVNLVLIGQKTEQSLWTVLTSEDTKLLLEAEEGIESTKNKDIILLGIEERRSKVEQV